MYLFRKNIYLLLSKFYWRENFHYFRIQKRQNNFGHTYGANRWMDNMRLLHINATIFYLLKFNIINIINRLLPIFNRKFYGIFHRQIVCQCSVQKFWTGLFIIFGLFSKKITHSKIQNSLIPFHSRDRNMGSGSLGCINWPEFVSFLCIFLFQLIPHDPKMFRFGIPLIIILPSLASLQSFLSKPF